MSNREYKHTFKVLLLGDAAVGKTALVRRFVHGKFMRDYVFTIGMEPYTRYETIDGVKTVFTIWDIAGEQKFANMRKMFFAGSMGALITFDLTRRETFENARIWITEALGEVADQELILVGNKNDLLEEREISEEEGLAFANEMNCIAYIETSALTGDRVEDAFIHLGKTLIEKLDG